MGNELINMSETVKALDKAARSGLMAQEEQNPFQKMFIIANAIEEMKKLLTPKVMEPIMNLQNTSLGFKTDNPAGYTVDVVRDCIIEASLKRVYPVGNEFNILARQCYITKEGFFHKLKDIKGLSWTETPGIPRNVGESGAVVKITLEWTFGGKSQSKELEFAVRVNKGMGADAIVGKATRKARAWLYTAITGQEIGDGDVDIVDISAETVNSPFEEAPAENSKIEQTLPM